MDNGNKPNINIVLETGSLSGGVRVVGEIANRLAMAQYPVSIWSVNHKETMTAWFKLDDRIKWYSFFRTGTTNDYDQLTDVLAKAEGVKLATYWRTAFPVSEACKEKGTGLYLVQDVETSYVSQPVMHALVMQSYAMSLQKITTSRWVEKNLDGCIHIGIGLDPLFKKLENMKRRALPLAIARRQALKGYGELMEVARYLAVASKNLSTFGLDKKLIGFVPVRHYPSPDDKSVRQMYNVFGCFISTSKHEGFSLSPLEAMACGLPIVTTNADGNMEYCEDGVNCLIGTDPPDIAQKVLQVLEDKGLAEKLAKNGLEAPRRYRWSAVIDNIRNLL